MMETRTAAMSQKYRYFDKIDQVRKLNIYHQLDNPDLIEHIERARKIFYQKSRNRGQ